MSSNFPTVPPTGAPPTRPPCATGRASSAPTTPRARCRRRCWRGWPTRRPARTCTVSWAGCSTRRSTGDACASFSRTAGRRVSTYGPWTAATKGGGLAARLARSRETPPPHLGVFSSPAPRPSSHMAFVLGAGAARAREREKQKKKKTETETETHTHKARAPPSAPFAPRPPARAPSRELARQGREAIFYPSLPPCRRRRAPHESHKRID